MTSPNEFLLDLFVYEVLQGNRRAARQLVRQALAQTYSTAAILSEIIWPTMECVEQLRADGTLSSRIHNSATNLLHSISELVAADMGAAESNGRSMLLCTVPGQSQELGSGITALTAEACGWRVYFGGAGLSEEEITFALGRLDPDVLALHGNHRPQHRPIAALLRRLRQGGIFPKLQVALCGAIVVEHDFCGADVAARDPIELMEILALCPDYRARAQHSLYENWRTEDLIGRRWHLN